MKILNKYPPNFKEIAAKFPVEKDHPVFCFADTIYNPYEREITDDLIAHEEVHSEQQEHHPDVAAAWWRRFIADAEWRIEQEAEAYAAQYNFLCRKHKDKNKQIRILVAMGQVLGGGLYGDTITPTAARAKILEYARGITDLKDE